MILRVRVANPMAERRGIYAHHIPPISVYEGEVLKRKSWMSDSEFCLSTGDKRFPFRIIDVESVIDGYLLAS
jgi:hypothetical protein